MSEVIYKYGPIFNDRTTEYEGTPVHVGIQDGHIYLWCKLRTGKYVENPKGKVSIYPTGLEFVGDYIGTAVTSQGWVWHVIGVDE